jgi:hypothetical protein
VLEVDVQRNWDISGRTDRSVMTLWSRNSLYGNCHLQEDSLLMVNGTSDMAFERRGPERRSNPNKVWLESRASPYAAQNS